MNKITRHWLLLIAGIFLVSCKITRELPFETGQRMALKIDPGAQPIPSMVILASPQDLAAASALYSDSLSEWLKDVDFNTRIAVLYAVGQIRDNGEVEQIERLYDTVQVQLKGYSIGPGNYEIAGWSEPYQLLLIEKEGPWKRQVRFILIAKDNGVLHTVEQYIP